MIPDVYLKGVDLNETVLGKFIEWRKRREDQWHANLRFGDNVTSIFLYKVLDRDSKYNFKLGEVVNFDPASITLSWGGDTILRLVTVQVPEYSPKKFLITAWSQRVAKYVPKADNQQEGEVLYTTIPDEQLHNLPISHEELKKIVDEFINKAEDSSKELDNSYLDCCPLLDRFFVPRTYFAKKETELNKKDLRYYPSLRFADLQSFTKTLQLLEGLKICYYIGGKWQILISPALLKLVTSRLEIQKIPFEPVGFVGRRGLVIGG